MVRTGYATNCTGFDKTPMRNQQCLAAFWQRPGYVEVEVGQLFGQICDNAAWVLTDIRRKAPKSFVEKNLHIFGHGSEQVDLLVDRKSHGNAGFKCAGDSTRVDLVECRHFLSNPSG